MAKKNSEKRFTFNDPNQKNSHGFLIPTEGISLERFKKNPVMLDMHYNSTYSVIGKWEDIQVKEGLLSGLPDFDTDDEVAARIAGKVDRDYIKGCSMGITFTRDDLKYIGGQLILEKCELYEVSIVAVPSNANSIHLYHSDGKTIMTDQEVQELCLSAIPVNPEIIDPSPRNPQTQNMKVTLTALAALALGMPENQTEIESEELSAKIATLDAAKKAAELKLSARVTADEETKLSAITTKVKKAITEGRFKADKETSLVNLGIANETLLDETLAAVPAKTSLKDQLEQSGTQEVKTSEDFQKLSHTAQLEFKTTNPEGYKQLFTKTK